MPKRVPEEAKRVALNCLVLPETLDYLKSAPGSQGAVVDRAVAALRFVPPAVLDGLVNQGRGNQNADEPLMEVVAREVRRHVGGLKRGPREKGDKTR